jgi:hypothetical protein
MTKTIEMLRAAIFTGALCFLPAGAQAADNVPDHQEAEEPPFTVTCQKHGDPHFVPDHQEAQSRCGDVDKGDVKHQYGPGDVPDHQEAEEGKPAQN